VTELIYTDAAERDLTRISVYIGADSPQAARRFVERLSEHCAYLVHFPDMGPRRSDIRADVRALTHGSYVIYYLHDEAADEVRILRIWHGRRRTPTAADLF
jgi:toxin ParE1/3/4